jgi:hypothetical protein
MAVIVISLGTPQRARENFQRTWKHLGVRATCPEEPATSLRAPRLTVEQSGKPSSLGMLQVRLEIIATTYRATIVKTHVSRLYSHLCIYVSMYLCIHIVTHLHTIYLDWVQEVLESNSRCA